MNGDIVIVRGGGDIATGTIQKLHRSGYRVLVLEIAEPTVIRRTVSVSTCMYEGKMVVEDITAVKCEDKLDVYLAWEKDEVPVIADPTGEYIEVFQPKILVDAILAKKNVGFTNLKALGKIALGPGFIAGVDADIVIETNRGHNLSRLIFEGPAAKNTGSPGMIGGYTDERVMYSDYEGEIKHIRKLGDVVKEGEAVATVGGQDIVAKIPGVLRGLIQEGYPVTKGLKIADVDPRESEVNNCFTISDKARAIGGGALEAVQILVREKNI